jgi:hypothetical protein
MELNYETLLHLASIAILTAYLSDKLCGGKEIHKNFQRVFIYEFFIQSQKENMME